MSDITRIDLRGMPMEQRHPLIFGSLYSLEPGDALEIANDHDPSGLSYRLAAEHPGRFTWTWIEQGPVDWRFRVERTGQPVAADAAG